MADDAGRLLVRIEATQAKFEKQMAAIAKSGAASAKSVENSFKKANDNIVKGSPQAAKAIGSASQAAGQLSFQLNDIATSLAGGASPFQVMMQQGSQVTQVFQQMGGGLKGIVGVVGGAVGSMLNPISLLTFGFIYLTGKALEYFTATDEGSKETQAAFKKENDLLQDLARKYGVLLPVVKALAEAREAAEGREKVKAGTELAIAESYKKLEPLQDRIKAGIKDVDAAMANNVATTDEQKRAADEYESAVVALNKAFADHLISSAEIERLYVAIGAVIDMNDEKFANLRKTMNEAFIASRQQAIQDADARQKAQKATDAAVEKLKKYNEAMEELRRLSIPAMTTVEKLWNAYAEAIKNATTELERHDAELRLNQGLANEAAKATSEVLTGNSAELIKKEEGFRSNAYWDTNAFRVGFGSDTYVDAMGRVQQVTKDTVVTLDQANQDLARRIGEFQSTIQSQIGPDMWRAFTESQQAALTSIAYNYGELPRSIVKAIKAGDQGQVATAISELSANPARRKREAQQFAGGSAAAGDALQIADDYKTARKALEEYLATLDEQATLQQRINDINASGLSADEKTTAIAVETELQKALNLAKQNGLTLSEQEIALIRQKAVANAAADITAAQIKDAAKLQADALKDAQRAAEEFQKSVQSAVGGLIKDLIAGKDAAESFSNALSKIADKAIDMAIDNLFSMGGKGGTGGLLGGMIIPGILHKGGIAGVDGYGTGRAVSASAFRGAKRYHSGGMVGAGEVPAILKRGELVLPAGAARKGGSGDTVNVRLHDDSGRMAAIADQRIQTASGTIVKVSVVQSTKTVQQRLPGMLANAQVRSG